MKPLYFIDDKGTFTVQQPENISYLYFPLASEAGLKSAVTPNLGGDSKIDQDTFLLKYLLNIYHFQILNIHIFFN